jgi:hypothetical protein
MGPRDFEIFDHEHRLMFDALRDGTVRAGDGEELVRMHHERTRTRLTENRDLFDR